MDHQIDARGKICPIPVVMAKKEADSGSENFSILVDNETAVENLKRFAGSRGYEASVTENGSDFEIGFVKSGNSAHKAASAEENTWAVFVGKERIGEGDPELGSTLMKMFFFTLLQEDNIPSFILFMNGGVKLPAENEQVVEHLKELQEKGAEILVCGTCLNFYGIADQLKAGTVSNMYDIVGAMKAVDKVITI